MKVPDQEKLWDKKHGRGEHAAHRGHPAHFAVKAAPYLSKQGQLLDIGCGVASDSVYFADLGYQVLATDISQVVLDQGSSGYVDVARLQFQKMDISQKMPFKDGAFDVVYSHLALHYYDNATTHEVFQDIARILRSGGVFAFACKSIDDVDYGDGEQVEKDLFISTKGHVRHFFTQQYVRELLGDMYDIELLEDIQEHYSNKTSAFVQCIAIKK